jgi:hypothetical protein
MPIGPLQRAVRATAVLAGIALYATPITAQATRDQSRLVIGVSAGYIGGTDLWSVSAQPIRTSTEAVDVYALERRLRPNVTLTGHATWFKSANLGFTGEVSYIGLGTEDKCRLSVASGDPLNRLACLAINGNQRPASAVSVGGGVVFRPASRAFLQPYARAVGGIAIAPRSVVRTVGTIGAFGDTVFSVYAEDNSSDSKLLGTLAVGLATSASPGYQFRIELRNSWIQLPIVTGPTAFQGLVPPTRTAWKALPSLVVGFDIVLEKRRGRRY